eukprot:11935275-Alexandrium_andersonii.AAC.1
MCIRDRGSALLCAGRSTVEPQGSPLPAARRNICQDAHARSVDCAWAAMRKFMIPTRTMRLSLGASNGC